MEEKISIIIPVYNGERFIRRCINSVLKQTYSNIEIIVVDDGSSDGSPDILRQMAEKDDRLRCFRKKNGGVSSARNYGLEKATGELIMFVDIDDYVDDHICEKLLRVIQAGKDYAVCGYRRIAKEEKEDFLPGKGAEDPGKFEDQFKLLLNNAAIYTPWGKLFRKDLIRVPFDVNRSLGEDLEFNIHYFENCGQLGWLDECLYYYDVSAENSLSKRLQANLGSDIEVCGIIEAFMSKRNINAANFSDKYYSKFRHKLSRAIEYRYTYRQFKELFFAICDEGGYSQIVKEKKATGLANKLTRWSIILRTPVIVYVLAFIKRMLK